MSYRTEHILTGIQSNMRSSPATSGLKSPTYMSSITQTYKPLYTTLSHQNEIEQKYHEDLEHSKLPATITASTYRNNFLSSNHYGSTNRSASGFKVEKVDKSEMRFVVKREIESYIRMLRSEFTEAINEIRREMYTSNQVQNELANFDSTLSVQQNKIDRYTEEINNNANRLDILDREFLKTNTELNSKIKNMNSDLTQMKIKFNTIIRNKAFFKSAKHTVSVLHDDDNVNSNSNQYDIEYNENEPDYEALYSKKVKDNEEKLRQTVKELEAQIQVSSAQRVDSINKELLALRSEIHAVKNDNTFSVNNKLNQVYTKQEVDNMLDNNHRNNLNHVTSTITTLNERINKIDVNQLQHQIRNEDLTKQTASQLDEINKLKSAIATLTQNVQEQATQTAQLATRFESSNDHNKSLLNTFNTINNNSINLNNALHSLAQLTQTLKQHEVSLQTMQNEMNTVKSSLNALNSHNALSPEFASFKTESTAQLSLIHSKVAELANDLDKQSKELNAQLYALSNSMNMLESDCHSSETHLNKQLNDISAELTKQNTQINANATQIAVMYQRMNSVDQRNSYSNTSMTDKAISCPVVDLNQLYAKVEVLNQKVPMLETQLHTFSQTQQSYNETITSKVSQLERNKIIPMQSASALNNEEFNSITESINIINDKIPSLEAKINTMNMSQQTFNSSIKQKIDAYEQSKTELANDVKHINNDIQTIMNDKIPAMESQVNALQMQIGVNSNNNSINKLDAITARLNNIESSQTQTHSKLLPSIMNDINAINTKIPLIEKQLQQVQQEAACNVSSSNNAKHDELLLSNYDTQLNTLTSRLNSIEQDLQPLSNEIGSLQKELPAIENKLVSFQILQQKVNDTFVNSLKELNGKNSEIEEDLNEYDDNFESINKKLLELNNNSNMLQQISTELYKQFQLMQNERVQQNKTINQWANGLKSNLDQSIKEIKTECERIKQQQQQMYSGSKRIDADNLTSKIEGGNQFDKNVDWDFDNNNNNDSNVMSYKK